jgi:acetyl esterase/lipase
MRRRCAWQVLGLLAVGVGILRATPPAALAEEAYDAVPDQVYVERPSGPLKADVYVPHGDGPFPAMLVVNGGAWATGTKAQLAGVAQALAKHGYTTAAISYRLAPQDKFPAQVYDCQAAVRWLRANAAKYKVDTKRVGGYGYSAGGHLVALLGAMDDDDFREPGVAADAPSARLQVVVAGGAPCDFRVLPADSGRLAYWLGGTPAEKPEAYKEASPYAYITPDDPPMFFFHGGADQLVPIRSPKRMVEGLKAAHVPAEFYEVPGAGHLGAVMNRPAMLAALAFVDEKLKNAKTPAVGESGERASSEGKAADDP